MAKGKYPAVIVIYNPSFLLRHHTEPHAIKAAMYGFDTHVLGLAPIHMRQKPRLLDRKSGSGQKMGSQFNTTVSAVSVLDFDGLTVNHNVFAALSDSPVILSDACRSCKYFTHPHSRNKGGTQNQCVDHYLVHKQMLGLGAKQSRLLPVMSHWALVGANSIAAQNPPNRVSQFW